jgi:hypothetical protein
MSRQRAPVRRTVAREVAPVAAKRLALGQRGKRAVVIGVEPELKQD